MAVVKNTTSRIATNRWNFWIFSFTVLLTLVFLLAAAICGKKKTGGVFPSVTAGLLSALLIFYELPDVLAYPVHFKIGDSGVLSMAFLVRLIGVLAALILLWIFCRNLYRSVRSLDRDGVVFWVLVVTSLLNAARCLGQMLRPWITRAKFLPDFLPRYQKAEYPWAFPFAQFVANNTLLFTCLIAGFALLIPLLSYAGHLKITKPYSNPAQLRG